MISRPLVSIKCIVYNQEPYIRQCLAGIVMQQTDFSFDAIVHDDASTDGTAAIIEEFAQKYPQIIRPIYQTENQYSKRDGSLRRIIDAQIRGKYIAICEGDDYWTDPLKLQKQVDFLESNADYGMCYSKVKQYNQKRGKYIDTFGSDYISLGDLLLRNTIPTLSVMMRADLCSKYTKEIMPHEHKWRMGDYPMWLWMAQNSKIHFIGEVVGVYRILGESASHFVDKAKEKLFEINAVEIALFFAKRYKVNEDFVYFKLLWAKFNYAAIVRDKVAMHGLVVDMLQQGSYVRSTRGLMMRIFVSSPRLFVVFVKLLQKIKSLV